MPDAATAAEKPLVSQPRTAEAHQLLDVLCRYVNADIEGAEAMIRRCRAGSPKCTLAQIAAMVEIMKDEARKKDSPFAWLIKYLPKKFEDNPFERPVSANPTRLEVDLDKAAPLPDTESEEIRDLYQLRDGVTRAINAMLVDPYYRNNKDRREAKLARLQADRDNLQARIDEALARKPIESEQTESAKAVAGD